MSRGIGKSLRSRPVSPMPIAAANPGGGAGLLRDVATAAALGARAHAVGTAWTEQGPGLHRVEPREPEAVRAALAEALATLRPVAVQVTCSDRPGLLAAISKSFTEHGVNISQAKCRTTEDGRAVNTFQVTVGHLEQLKTVLRTLETIEGVVSATRL